MLKMDFYLIVFFSLSAIADIDLYILKFEDYGKEFPKQHNMSPDAFIQMCLQFTYFKFVEFKEFLFILIIRFVVLFFLFDDRMYDKLVSTYESASTRRFHCGRVDNIRANTPEALQWARAMVDETGTISAKEKLRLFRLAMQAQTDLMVQVKRNNNNENRTKKKPSIFRIFLAMAWIVIVCIRFPLRFINKKFFFLKF